MHELLPEKYKDVSMKELVTLDIDIIKGLPQASRRELHKLQDELIEFEKKDAADDRHYIKEEDVIKMHELLPSKYQDHDKKELKNLIIDNIYGLPDVSRRKLKKLQAELKHLDHLDDMDQASERHQKEEEDVVKMHELLPEQYKELSMRELENIDINNIKGLPQASQRELHKLQDELKHIDQADQACDRHQKEEEDVVKMH